MTDAQQLAALLAEDLESLEKYIVQSEVLEEALALANHNNLVLLDRIKEMTDKKPRLILPPGVH